MSGPTFYFCLIRYAAVGKGDVLQGLLANNGQENTLH